MHSIVFAAALLLPAAAAQPVPVTYHPPVEAPVVDGFRPPPAPWSAGNRGLEYDTEPGTPVRAAAAGSVVFAGVVAGTRHVTILHADGLRTSYSLLDTVVVAEGAEVGSRAVIGRAGERLFFSVRAGNAYLDPAVLLLGPAGDLRLVPDHAGDDHRPAGTVSAAAAAWARAPRPSPPAGSGGCTAATVEPLPPPERRVAVLVGGLGSSSAGAAVDDIDTVALGYAPGDALRFSYAGGRVPDPSDGFAEVPAAPYRPADTTGPLDRAGRRLAALLAAVADSAPGTPIDIIGHSQGGIVARAALLLLPPPVLDAIGVVVTLGSPHQGADLAALAGDVADLPGGAVLLDALAWTTGMAVTTASPAVAQLAVGSPFLAQLARAGLPPGVPVLSIAARADVVVPAPRSELPGAVNVVVSVEGWNDHDRLPGSRGAAREIALALAGLPPRCEGFVERVADALVSSVVGTASRLAEWLVPG